MSANDWPVYTEWKSTELPVKGIAELYQSQNIIIQMTDFKFGRLKLSTSQLKILTADSSELWKAVTFMANALAVSGKG